MEKNHRDTLRYSHLQIINSLDLSNTEVLDILQEDSVISSGEQDEILSLGTKREQNSLLLAILEGRGPSKQPFDRFLRALSSEYKFLEEYIQNTYLELTHLDLLQDECVCPCCSLYRHLRPHDVSHQLFQKGIIKSMDDLQVLNNKNIPRKGRLLKLQEILLSHTDCQEAFEIFRECMEMKYDYIINGVTTLKQLFSCVNDGDAPIRCEMESPEQQHKMNSEIMESSLTPENNNGMGQRRKRCKTATRKRPCEEPCSSEVILHRVQKSCPFVNKKLMRLKRNTWKTLYGVRVKRDWDLHDRITNALFKKFKNNPDIQVLLYRNEMSISTSYVVNHKKALDMYNKAKSMINQTSMPNWHLPKMLNMQAEIHMKAGEFGTAENFIIEAYQVSENLKPCMVTGAVYFQKAIFLANLIHCTQSGTRLSQLQELVRNSFLTAIDHCEQEQFFPNKCCLKQIYIYIALFSLGVDFRKIRYTGIQVTESDVQLATNFLNLFEDSCWDIASSWWHMLFFIGRAEQHKQKGNYGRSADYFEQAMRYCELELSYSPHKQFIEQNMEYVNKKARENCLRNELRQQRLTRKLMESTR